jgi:phage FluMu protein Com
MDERLIYQCPKCTRVLPRPTGLLRPKCPHCETVSDWEVMRGHVRKFVPPYT